jgi:hypothetical protein
VQRQHNQLSFQNFTNSIFGRWLIWWLIGSKTRHFSHLLPLSPETHQQRLIPASENKVSERSSLPLNPTGSDASPIQDVTIRQPAEAARASQRHSITDPPIIRYCKS